MTVPVLISKTKIVVPHRRSELISRNRLLGTINAARDRKMTLLCAPAGYGKTSLLLDFAHSTDLPVCWLSLDPLDRDPQRFMSYMIAALAEQFPGVAAPLQSILGQLKSIEHDAEPLLVALTNELYEQVEDDFLFILDDYHILDDVPVISSLLNRFLQLVDENCHVILSSRVPPSLPDLTLMIAREQVNGINQADLAFLPRELQSFLAQILHQDVSDEDAQALIDRTGGWITGIILSNQTGMSGIVGADTFTYLSRQVLDEQPEYMREFLLRTSLPDVFDARLCEEILSPFYKEAQNWSEHMEQILKRNLFVLPLGDNKEHSLRYHPLFREFLQQRLKEERPEEVKPILELLTKAYEQKGEWEKAYSTCQQVDDVEALAAVVEISGTFMLKRAFTTLDGWLSSLPPSIINKRAGLMSVCGAMAIMKGNLQEAIEMLDTAELMYRNHDDNEGLSLVLVRRAFAERIRGDYIKSLADVEEALKLSEPYAFTHFIYAEALRVKGINLYRLGQARQAVKYKRDSLELYITMKDTDSISTLKMEYGLVLLALGDVDAAKVLFLDAQKIWLANRDYFSLASLMSNLGGLYNQIGDYNLAADVYEKGLEYSHKMRYERAEALNFLGLGDLYAEVEEYELAELAYQKVAPIAKKFAGSFVDTYLILVRANLAVLQGDSLEAHRILKPIWKTMETNPSLYERGLYELLNGRIHLLENRTGNAITAFEACRANFIADGREIESMWSHLWLGIALFHGGRPIEARDEVRKALSRDRSAMHALLVVLQQAKPWLHEMQKDSQIGYMLSGAVNKTKLFEAKLPAIRRILRRSTNFIQASPSNLVIKALGRVRVQVDGKAITMADWQTQSVRELFFFLLAADRPMTKEQIGEVLWPDTIEPSKLKLRFKNDLYRLRRAVGRDTIVFENNCYRFNPVVDHEYDVEAFEAHLAKARSSITPEEQIEKYQKAINMVHGPYLEDFGATWVWPQRERLSQAFLSALLTLAELYQKEGQPSKALICCQRALDYDPALEAVYCLMMQIYHRMGDRSSIVRIYQTCENNMQRIFDLTPSEETKKIYRDLII